MEERVAEHMCGMQGDILRQLLGAGLPAGVLQTQVVQDLC